MVDNQHRKIKGYRDLSEEEIALMNEIKEQGARLNELIDKLAQSEAEGIAGCEDRDAYKVHNEAMRWLSISKTHLQQGLMALTRAVAKPEFF